MAESEVMVEILYSTPARFGERMGVSLHDALTNHPQAHIVAFADGSSFDTPAGAAALEAAKAGIKEDKAEAKAAAKADRDDTDPPAVVASADGV